MQYDNEIRQVVENVWSSMIGLSPRPVAVAVSSPLAERRVVAVVRIYGAWSGAVTLSAPLSLARRAAAAMFGVDVDATTDADAIDALGEIANMTGGNIKSLLPGDCALSLPAVTIGAAGGVDGGTGVGSSFFEIEGEMLTVNLLAGVR
ncbi:MAG TPA: chemotaxis protein CheX [Planctomycetota bacterium]|nr:chemotaxis protein CheX [Planctomycetota bacterium]